MVFPSQLRAVDKGDLWNHGWSSLLQESQVFYRLLFSLSLYAYALIYHLATVLLILDPGMFHSVRLPFLQYLSS